MDHDAHKKLDAILGNQETFAVWLQRIAERLEKKDRIIMTTQADIDIKVTALNAKVTAETDAEKAVITLLGGIKTQLDAVKAELAAANPALDLSGLDAIGASIDSNAAASAAAVVANTPVAATQPQPAPVPAPTA
jgi:hypothetical protein